MARPAYPSWGLFPAARHRTVHRPAWRDQVPEVAGVDCPVLPRGLGRSYGDSCLNDGGTLVDLTLLNRFISFDPAQGILQCEAGTSLAEVLALTIPHGWFLPVTPGTKYVTVGGAIANDVHGKNHHAAGTFGGHVRRFELLRSGGERFQCSPDRNSELFNATIGGLGLTGIILWAEIGLKRVSSCLIAQERLPFADLSEFFELSRISDAKYEYTVSWIDCLHGNGQASRGIFIRGSHSSVPGPLVFDRGPTVRFPFPLPSRMLHPRAFRAFNSLYYLSQKRKGVHNIGYEPFFYPLDRVRDWNRVFAAAGFLQYQCVVPPECEERGMREILSRIARSGEGSVLAVLKKFGAVKSPGLLSFPRPGTTLALDFPYRGQTTLRLLDDLDSIVREAKGAVYPAKDARMSARSFKEYFPGWCAFAGHIDPCFSSGFWRRVTQS